MTNYNAYEISKEISKAKDNLERKSFVLDLARKLSLDYGLKLQRRKIDIDPLYGDENIILRSGFKNHLLLVAHYDSFVIDAKANMVSPGANDNGSGVGVVSQAICSLLNLPVDIAFLGGEEIYMRGAERYLLDMEYKPSAVISLDTCGSPGDLGMLIPKEFYTIINDDELNGLTEVNPLLNKHFIDVAKERGYKVCLEDNLANGDHSVFLRAGIDATTIQGEDLMFYGIENNKYNHEKMIMHSKRDLITCVNPEFLQQVIYVLVNGSKSYIQQNHL